MRILTFILAFLSLGAMAVQAQNVALVISNGYYEDGADAPSISRRHQQLVSAFQAQGYEVIEGKDQNRVEIRQLLNHFETKIATADIAVISLQGHMVNFGEKTWLLPTDVDVASATGVEFRAVSLGFFAQLLAQAPSRSVLFVGDSGRAAFDIPGVSSGIARINLPQGVMMVSGGFSEVSNVIRSRFLQRNQRVIDVLRGDIGSLEIEGDIPASLVLANRRVAAVNTAEQIEAGLGLDRRARLLIQKDLVTLGFDTRGVDGLFGNGTRGAIREWQRRQGLARTGYLTTAQISILRQQAETARMQQSANDRQYWARTGANGTARGLQQYLERYPNGQFANRARAELARMNANTDEQAWSRAVRADTPESYRQYLHDFPNGIYKNIARARIGTPPVVVENSAQRVEAALRLNTISRLLIEQRLADLGYRTGPRDGAFDLATRQGIRSYQQDRGLDPTGYVTADMIRLLLLGQ